MTKDPRITGSTLKVLVVLLENQNQELAGSDIRKFTDIGAGTLYPILARLEKAGWVESHWEDVDPSKEGRPRKRFYRLTGIGETKSRRALKDTLRGFTGDLSWV